jgi:RNA polymerase sigma-70 factor (ECF subfamily)
MGDDPSAPESVTRRQDLPPEAAARLFTRYAEQLTRLADQHLDRRLASRVDGEDIVQSVFRTFFRRSAGGELAIDGSSNLWRLLVRITVLKARAVARRHTAGVRDVAAEAGGATAGFFEAIARGPGPEDAAAFVDEIEALLRGLPALYARLVELRLQGHSSAEIASILGVSSRTVQRALHLLKQRLERAGDASAPDC